jgi:hypothetical protein
MPIDNAIRSIIDAEKGPTNLGYIGGISDFRRHTETIVIISID